MWNQSEQKPKIQFTEVLKLLLNFLGFYVSSSIAFIFQVCGFMI